MTTQEQTNNTDMHNSTGGLLIAAMGGSDFTLGFELVGIKTIIPTEGLTPEQRLDTITTAMRRDDLGIIIMDEAVLAGINAYERQQLENTIRPVVVVLSDELGDAGTLRRQIMRAIGVDLYAHDTPPTH